MDETKPETGAARQRFAEHRPAPKRGASAAQRKAAAGASAPKNSPESAENRAAAQAGAKQPKEIGGPKGPEPTRFGDWERDGRCVDF